MVETPAGQESPSTAELILDATLLVVGERGLKGATTRLIAERANVNEVTLFRKFGNKMNLVKEAVIFRFETLERQSISFTGYVEEDLIRLAESYQAALGVFGSFARAMLTEVPFEPGLADAWNGPRRMFAAVAEMLGKYQAEGVLQEESPESLVPAFLGPIAMPYMTRLAKVSQGLDDVSFDARAHVVRFLHGRTRR